MYSDTLFYVQKCKKEKDMPIRIDDHDHWRLQDSFYYGDYVTHGYTNANYSVEKHSQAFYELNIITRGSGTHWFGERTYPAIKGDVFIIPPNILHGYDGGEGFDVYHLLLSPSFMQKNSLSLSRLSAYSTLFHIDPMMRERVSDNLHLHLCDRDFDDVNVFLEQMEAIDESERICDGILSEAFATVVITKLCEVYARLDRERTEDDADSNFVKSLSYIYENYSRDITIDELVKMANMSRTAYLTKFKRVTGTTPGRLQAQIRIEAAKQLLCDPTRSLGQIAAEVGCYDTSHLVRLFKRTLGISPTEYRTSILTT